MGRLSHEDRRNIQHLMGEELEAVRVNAHEQASRLVETKKEELLQELGLEDKSAEKIAALDATIQEKLRQQQALQKELDELRAQRWEVSQHRLGDWSKPPTTEQIEGLGIVATRHGISWHGINLGDRLTAEACLRVKDGMKISSQVFDEIEKSLRNAFVFMTTMEEAKAVYANFRALKFERFGVDLVKDLGAIGGELDKLFTQPQLPEPKKEKKRDRRRGGARRHLGTAAR